MNYQSPTPPFPIFDSDKNNQNVIALKLKGGKTDFETPLHQHRKCQLVMPLTGYITCNISNTIWMVPAHSAAWIPSQMKHSNYISSESTLYILFIEPKYANLMPKKSCTLFISPLVKELIIYITNLDKEQLTKYEISKIEDVLMTQLIRMQTEQFDFPIPQEKRLNYIAKTLLKDPENRKTIKEWAKEIAIGERTLGRLIKKEIGLSFGQWRNQLHLIIALQKLSSGESVQRVSDDLGYESMSAFITYFKKSLGMSPKKYIKTRYQI